MKRAPGGCDDIPTGNGVFNRPRLWLHGGAVGWNEMKKVNEYYRGFELRYAPGQFTVNCYAYFHGKRVAWLATSGNMKDDARDRMINRINNHLGPAITTEDF